MKVSSVADGNRLYGRIMSVDPDPGSCSNAEEEFLRYSDKVQGWFNDKPSLIGTIVTLQVFICKNLF